MDTNVDKNKKAVEQLKQGIQFYVDKKIEKSNLDKTVNGIVKKVNGNETYNISINGVEYLNIKTIGGKCETNETVKVLIPQNNYNLMVILKGGNNGKADLPDNIVLSANEEEVKDLPSVNRGVTRLDQLDDVNVGNLENNQALVYDSVLNAWTNKKVGASGEEYLRDLKDVSLKNPSKNDILLYNGSNWINSDELSELKEKILEMEAKITELEAILEELAKNIFKVESVIELPSEIDEHTIYLIQGTVG